MEKKSCKKKIEKYKIEDIFEKIVNNKRISIEDAKRLYDLPDPLILGYLANLKREKLHKKKYHICLKPAHKLYKCMYKPV